MATHKVTYAGRWVDDEGEIFEWSVEDSNTAGTDIELDVTIPQSTTDQEIAFSFDWTNGKSIRLMSTKDITVKTNSATIANEVFTLVANKAVIWSVGAPWEDTGLPNPFSSQVDVVSFFVTNAGAEDAQFTVNSVQDPT